MSCKEITRGEVEVIEQGLREALDSEPFQWLGGGRWSHAWRAIRNERFLGLETPGFLERIWLQAATGPRY